MPPADLSSVGHRDRNLERGRVRQELLRRRLSLPAGGVFALDRAFAPR